MGVGDRDAPQGTVRPAASSGARSRPSQYRAGSSRRRTTDDHQGRSPTFGLSTPAVDRSYPLVCRGGSRGLSQAAAQGPTELSRANSAFPQQQGRTCNAGATLRGVWRGFPDGRAGGIGALAAAYVRDDHARALAEAVGDNARPQPAEDRAGPARTRLDPVD